MTYNADLTYAWSVAGDDPNDPWICAGTASCTRNGTYSTTGSELRVDEGEPDELSATYQVSSTTLTITFDATAQEPDYYVYRLQRN